MQEEEKYRERFSKNETFESKNIFYVEYGKLRKVNKLIRITDPEAEGLQVEARIFLFDSHLIIEYQMENSF